MGLLPALNRDHGITVPMITHEPDMAVCAHRRLQFVDSRVARDRPYPHPVTAAPAAPAEALDV